jgi:EamA domain-containing membrane protein RarD
MLPLLDFLKYSDIYMKRFEDLDTIVIEFWHVKQDLLEVYIHKILWSIVFIVNLLIYIHKKKLYTDHDASLNRNTFV